MVEAVLLGGPWFVNGHIVGMEKWTPEFSPLSMKGLTSPIWIRMPHLPLHCWDEMNIERIASMIGKSLMLDGNLFQWGRREFARVCVRVKIDQCLPLGVWVESISGRFFQKVEYEKISSFCFHCGMIGHMKSECKQEIFVTKEEEEVVSYGGSGVDVGKKVESINTTSYGPWVHVNHKRGRRAVQRSNFVKPSNMKYVKKHVNPVLEVQEDRIDEIIDVQKDPFESDQSRLDIDIAQLEEDEFILGHVQSGE
ncbi:hypothetical protein KFK09_000591 [Dendrobium nobile]|uniref:CCHC-type domain-containing protein n=1 Tax=Dendrobium nobile TaxID=94219 RepID=A0A8T3CCB3_DENNO|nr:hypothetical protein KFK09_000591 [Dendrobium nobile]